MKQIDKLAWIEIKDKKILSTRSFGKEKFYIPGGKREVGETDQQALTREIKEELNVHLDKNTLKFVGVFEADADGHAAGISVKMTCYTATYSGQLEASSEIAEIIWLTSADKDKISAVDRLIFDFLQQNKLLD